MSRTRRVVLPGLALTLALGSAGPLTAAQPPLRPSITLEHAAGFSAVSERTLASGAVIDTFRSGGDTVRVLGRPGSTMAIDMGGDVRTPSVTLTMSTSRPKTSADADAYAKSGRSAVKDLIALGVPADQALREFGSLDTPDGSPSPIDADVRAAVAKGAAQGQLASTTSLSLTAAVSTTVPYDTQCATIDLASSRVQGQGCSTYYLTYRNGGDWWLTDKFKLSAHSTDTGILPLRLQQVAWGVSWAAHNIIYDWDPSATIPISSSCKTLTSSVSGPQGSISISSSICPDSLGPSGFGGLSSGGLWKGAEHDTDYEAAIGTQEVHSPSNAAASYSSTYLIKYHCGGLVC